MGKKGTSQVRPKGGSRRGGRTARPDGRRRPEDLDEALEDAVAGKDGSLRRRLDSAAVVRREESSFSKLQPEFLEQLNLHASRMELKRPIRKSLTVFSHPEFSYSEELASKEEASSTRPQRPKPLLLLPKKPRWNHDLSAKAVQSNEKEVFRQWLEKTDEQVQAIFRQARDRKGKGRAVDPKAPGSETEDDAAAAIIPSLFERNLEVYQQLWRVVERSHVLLVLIDVRCPPIHLPPSLEDYLMRQGHTRRRRTILVLTKADLVEDAIAEDWKAWLSERYPQWQVVLTSSYVRREKQEGQGSRRRFESFISADSRDALLAAIEKAYTALVQPPDHVKADAEKLRQWDEQESQVEDNLRLGTVDFDALRQSTRAGQSEGISNTGIPAGRHDRADLVIGLIGQPNVGKSSLMNALLGAQKVRASKTPGKTKHYQTHLLLDRPSSLGAAARHTSRVMLCDSPGLVFPSLVGMEMQVLAGILPISQVQAASSCVEFAAHRMPLEKIHAIDFSKHGTAGESDGESLTALSILEALAMRHNFKTAKAGRPDTNRAANVVMRALAEGRIRWAFRPPPPDGKDIVDEATEEGVWLRDDVGYDHNVLLSEAEEEEDGEEQDSHKARSSEAVNAGKVVRFDSEVQQQELSEHSDEEDEYEEGQSEEEEEEEKTSTSRRKIVTGSMFAALQVEDTSEEEEEED